MRELTTQTANHDAEFARALRRQATSPARGDFSHVMTQLQQTVGNRAVQRMLSATLGHGTTARVQTKLSISSPEDAHEQEAERVAGQVMRVQDPAAGVPSRVSSLSTDGVHRACHDCEEELKDTMHRSGYAAASDRAAETVESEIGSLNGGVPLPAAERAFFEPRFNRDFSAVHIHDNSHAAHLASSVNAHAFTYGNQIVFNSGQYSPGSESGRHLLAHELTHVVQQGYAQPIAQQPASERAAADSGHQSQFQGFSSHLSARHEAAYDDQDDHHKHEGSNALIGAGVGAVLGGAIGGLVGGPIGLGVGAVIGGVIGGVVGSLIGGGISWKNYRDNYTSDNVNGASTTVKRPFNVLYKAVQDKAKNVWQLLVNSIEGGVTITVHKGGSRDPVANPPTSEAEAQDAVTTMKGYYARGSRGSWHTEAASEHHEAHHYREWKCSAEHYWPTAKASIEGLTVPLNAHASEQSAITAMRGGANGADKKMADFEQKAFDYWFTLADNAGSRPYAAGQQVLNNAVRQVQGLAAKNKWTVAQGTDSPSAESPCYNAWLPYTP